MKKKKLALLIPAHNEELVIKETLLAAYTAGMSYNDIYVVDDGSTDKTASIACKVLGRNCRTIKNVGKGNAIKEGLKIFRLLSRYEWISMTDADTLMDVHAKDAILQAIAKHPDVFAICGQVKTLKANWISHYRAYEYAIGHDFYKNIEDKFNMILITPGCCTTYNARLFERIEEQGTHVNDTLVEDYDLTLEIHKKLKEKVIYIASIVFWTQEPQTIQAYINQSLRWHRGWYQVAKKRFTFPFTRLDLLIAYFSIDPIIYTVELIGLTVFYFLTKNPNPLAYIFLTDCALLAIFALYASIAKKRVEIILAFPFIYFIRYLNLFLFLKAGCEVLLLKKYPLKTTTWNTPRYEIQ